MSLISVAGKLPGAEIREIGELVIGEPNPRKALAAISQKAFDRLPDDSS